MKTEGGKKAVNKWNGRAYKVAEDKGSSVVLEREDGSRFEIAKSEFMFSYKPKN